jgi:hypothetical protein
MPWRLTRCATPVVANAAEPRTVLRLLRGNGRITTMAADLERVLRRLEDAQEFARSYRFEITDEYRALIARVEAMSRNQPGADKSGARLGSRAERKAFFDSFSPVPPK